MLRLASLLWRLRRATTMETGLFEIQADHLRGFRQARPIRGVSDDGANRGEQARVVVQFAFGAAEPDAGRNAFRRCAAHR